MARTRQPIPLLVLVFLAAASASRGQDRRDRHGDLLPLFAISRLGTIRGGAGAPMATHLEARGLVFSPDGKTIASWGDSGPRLWDVEAGRERAPLEEASRWPEEAPQFTLDGARVRRGELEWEVATGKIVARRPPFQRYYRLPQDALVAPTRGDVWVVRDKGAIVIGSLESGEPLNRLACGSGEASALALSAGGSVAAGTSDGTVCLWGDPFAGLDIDMPPELRQLRGPRSKRYVRDVSERLRHWGRKAEVVGLTFSPDGGALGVLSRTQTPLSGMGLADRGYTSYHPSVAHVLDGGTGRERGLARGDASFDPSHLTFSPDGKWLAAWGRGLALLEAERARIVTRLPGDLVDNVVFSADGALAAAALRPPDGTGVGTVAILETTTGRERFRVEGRAAAFSSDRRTLAVAGNGIRLFDPDSGQERAPDPPRDGHTAAVRTIVFALRGATLLTGTSPQDRIWLWNAITGQPIRSFKEWWRDPPVMALSPDGAVLATTDPNGLRLWDTATGQQTRRIERFGQDFSALAFSPDGRLLGAGASWMGHVLVFDAATGALQFESTEEADRRGLVGPLRFSADGRSIDALVGDEVRSFSLPDGKARPPRSIAERLVTVRGASGDGTAIVSFRETLRIWDLDRPDRSSAPAVPPSLHTFLEGGDWLAAVALSPDRRTFAGALKNDVVVVDLAAGSALRLTGHEQAVRALAFSPDGALLASGSDDTTALVWDTRAVRARLDEMTGSP